MKSGRKATILVSAMTILLSLCLLAGATYALFGQKVDRTVEITAGSVSAQVEFQEEIKTYSMDKPMTAITEWLEMEIDAEKGITVTVELPDEAGNDFMLKSGKAIFTVQIAQGNATDQELDNAFSE